MKITLEDIAKKANVAPSTVYRALNNLSGVSAKKRSELLELSEAMGYTKNYYASSLKKGNRTFGLLLPEDEEVNFFSTQIKRGVLSYIEEKQHLQISIKQIPYRYAPDDLAKRLFEIVNDEHGKLDGILSFGSLFQEPLEALRLIKEKSIPVVHLISESRKEYCLTTVMPHSKMAGRMVADQLIQFNHNREYKKVLVIGDFRGTNQYYNSQGFEQQIWSAREPLEILKITNESTMPQNEVKAIVKRTLTEIDGVGAIYCCNTRGTIPMCEAVEELGDSQKIYTIGSDVFPKSTEAIKSGILTAVLHNQPQYIGYTAIDTLIKYLSEGMVPAGTVEIAPIIITKANVSYYAKENNITVS